MNILRAMASGQPFKRQAWTDHLTPGTEFSLKESDILATDWELFEQPLTITKSRLDQAFSNSKLDQKVVDAIYSSLGVLTAPAEDSPVAAPPTLDPPTPDTPPPDAL